VTLDPTRLRAERDAAQVECARLNAIIDALFRRYQRFAEARDVRAQTRALEDIRRLFEEREGRAA
jgi:hypothetical protein